MLLINSTFNAWTTPRANCKKKRYGYVQALNVSNSKKLLQILGYFYNYT